MVDRSFKRLWELFTDPGPARLGPERREGVCAEAEIRAEVEGSLAGAALHEANELLILSLLLLWHDHLDASHTISQGIGSADGSYLHAIMHRREPDYWNSKYWWRQVGAYPACKEIGRRVGERLQSAGRQDLQQILLRDGNWKPGAFVDACEAVADRPANDPEVTLLCALQQIEFQVLLERWTRD